MFAINSVIIFLQCKQVTREDVVFHCTIEHYGQVKFVTSNPRWADLVPPPTEAEFTAPLKEQEDWEEEVREAEKLIPKESWISEIRQRELWIGSH